jgi:hypothetical protein
MEGKSNYSKKKRKKKKRRRRRREIERMKRCICE